MQYLSLQLTRALCNVVNRTRSANVTCGPARYTLVCSLSLTCKTNARSGSDAVSRQGHITLDMTDLQQLLL